MSKRNRTWNRGKKAEKLEIGKRFKEFRLGLKKTQTDLSRELKVFQSTITNIEVGKTFPGLKYLKYFQDKYGLNINWLLNGIDRPFIPLTKKRFKFKSYLFTNLESSDPRLDKYQELIDLMAVPEVEEIILGKLTEIKLLAKEEIETFLKKRKNEDLEPTDEYNPLDHEKESVKTTSSDGENGVNDVQK